MLDHPAIMNDREVNAIIEGRKIAFIRMVAPKTMANYNKFNGAWQGIDSLGADWLEFVIDSAPLHSSAEDYRTKLLSLSPYGSPGDLLWVRETHFAVAPKNKDPKHSSHPPYDLWIDGQVPARSEKDGPHVMKGPMAVVYRASGKKTWRGRDWRPSIKMWRWACRLELIVEEIKLMRIQDIDHEGAMKQGIAHVPGKGYASDGYLHNLNAQSAIGALASWWDEMCLNGKRIMDYQSNPWVWNTSFSIDVIRSGIVSADDLKFKELEYEETI